jgi:hypothetical protein
VGVVPRQVVSQPVGQHDEFEVAVEGGGRQEVGQDACSL